MLIEAPWSKGRHFDQTPIHTEEKSVFWGGIEFQWERGVWDFQDGTRKDTYSLWNPKNWDEIATRLAEGQTCAMFVAGSYGVGKIFESPEWQSSTDAYAEGRTFFEKIKKRPYKDNFVAFIDPDDQINVIDIDRLDPSLKKMRWATERHNSYAWAQHNIFPARDNGLIDRALLRLDLDEEGNIVPEDRRSPEHNTIACFWIPNHWGFEGVTNEVRKMRKHGIFGGGSLNFHGDLPGFTSEDLYKQMDRAEEWKEEIDFVIFDEISEYAGIARSQSMVSFARPKPALLRQGSLTAEEIARRTGLAIDVVQDLKFASKLPQDEYSTQDNTKALASISWVEYAIQEARMPLFKAA